jgi:hypothetical protein
VEDSHVIVEKPCLLSLKPQTLKKVKNNVRGKPPSKGVIITRIEFRGEKGKKSCKITTIRQGRDTDRKFEHLQTTISLLVANCSCMYHV